MLPFRGMKKGSNGMAKYLLLFSPLLIKHPLRLPLRPGHPSNRVDIPQRREAQSLLERLLHHEAGHPRLSLHVDPHALDPVHHLHDDIAVAPDARNIHQRERLYAIIDLRGFIA